MPSPRLPLHPMHRNPRWRLEAILLDPAYSAKGAAGFIDLIRKGHFKKGERVVFLHTGGSVALFGYDNAFDFSGNWTA